MKRWWIVILLMLTAGLAQAEPNRGLLLIYDARDDRSVEIALQLVQQLKQLRSAGHFAPARNLSTRFATADLNVPAYAKLVQGLGLQKPVPLPYLGLVSLRNGRPQKVLWGQRVDEARRGLSALDTKLGLTTPVSAGPPPWAQAATQDTTREALAEMLLRIDELNERR